MTPIMHVMRRYLGQIRLLMVGCFLFALYALVIWRLYGLQMQRGEYYAARAASQAGAGRAEIIPRRDIYGVDKNGNMIPFATNKITPVIFAVPKEIEDVPEVSARLSALLGIDESRLEKMLAKPNDRYELLVQKASPSQVGAIGEAAIKGVYVEDAERRFYPFGELAAHVLGYVGEGEDGEQVGRYGVEAGFDERIKKETLTLTIDRNIQAQAEEILGNLVSAHKAVGGTVIVTEPSTGKIMALANSPSFDPNDYGKYDIKNFLNPAVQAVYEPGSIFKVLTMVSALDAGAVKPTTTFFDSGELTLNGKTIKNWDNKGHGLVTMTSVIEESINTGAAFAERKLGHDQFYKYVVDFGFNEKTKIDLPGEVKGSLRPIQRHVEDINFATASYGQGVSVTPIALARAVGAIANGGLLMKPYITEYGKPSIVRRVVAKDAATAVTTMMVSAVNKAKVAAIDGYSIAGKTGTAQIPDFKSGGYTHDVVNTYVGFAPAFDPRFLILVKLDKPEGAPLAGATVVPAFRELAEFVINYLHIPPDRKP